jgi:uncharacterized protein (TIGR02246 family)
MMSTDPTTDHAAAQATEHAVLAAAERLVRAFAAHDTEAYFDAFDPQASFIFHAHPEVLDDRDAYRRLWGHWEQVDGLRILDCRSTARQVRVLGDVAIFHHQVRTRVAGPDGPCVLDERETIVFQRAPDGRWRAVHEHLSPLPAGAAPAAEAQP